MEVEPDPDPLLGPHVLNGVGNLVKDLPAQPARHEPAFLHRDLRQEARGNQPMPGFGDGELVVDPNTRVATPDNGAGRLRFPLLPHTNFGAQVRRDIVQGRLPAVPNSLQKTEAEHIDRQLACLFLGGRPIAHGRSLAKTRALTLRTVSESPEQIRRHIAALTEFEQKYGEYLRAHEEDWAASLASGAVDAPNDLGSDMSAADFARLAREVKMLATRADRAIKLSGVAPVDGSGDLPSLAFDFEVNDGYFSDDGMSLQRELLERIPSQISGLEMRLEEAEARSGGSIRLPGRPTLRWGWINHPWTITIVGGTVAGVIAWLVVNG